MTTPTPRGCNWSCCGRPGRPYPAGTRCARHTPAALAGLPEPQPGPGIPRYQQQRQQQEGGTA